MSEQTKKRLIYVAPEASFGTETGTVGEYLPIQAENLSFITSGPEVLETAYFTGTASSTPADRGGEYCEVTFDMPLRGFASGQAAAVISSGDVDALDHILSSAFGTATAQTGVGVGSGSSTSSLVTDADITTNQYLGAAYGATTNSNKVQWRRLSGIATPYAPNANYADAPDAADSVFGTRSHKGPFTQGLSLSMYYSQDTIPYVLLGGRPTALKITAEAGKRVMVSCTIRFDNKTQASRAVTGVSTFSPAPIKALLAGCTWGSTATATSSIEIDWQLSSPDISSATTTNGRSDIECIMADPIVTLTPPFVLAQQTDFEAGTLRNLLIEFGMVNSASVMNSCCFFAENAEIVEAPDSDDGGIIRQSLKLACRFNGNFAATTNHSHAWQFSRA